MISIPPYTIFPFDILESTNRHIKENPTIYPDWAVIWTREQTSGRGRFDRTWQSSPGDDLTFSLYIPLKGIEKLQWANLTQIMALSLHEALLELDIRTSIKWPNDLLIEGKKLCGILCELTQQRGSPMAILGVGLNVNSAPSLMQAVDRPATSLNTQTSKIYDLSIVLSYILERFYENVKTLQGHNFEQLRKKIAQNLTFTGEHIIIVDGDKRHSGSIIDLNHDGTLLFACDECGTITLHSGEISFRT
ncbi:MAG: biotin--[acetyl-CoA-carboxylase] ligase [Fibrobacterales bacterium]